MLNSGCLGDNEFLTELLVLMEPAASQGTCGGKELVLLAVERTGLMHVGAPVPANDSMTSIHLRFPVFYFPFSFHMLPALVFGASVTYMAVLLERFFF